MSQNDRCYTRRVLAVGRDLSVHAAADLPTETSEEEGRSGDDALSSSGAKKPRPEFPDGHSPAMFLLGFQEETCAITSEDRVRRGHDLHRRHHHRGFRRVRHHRRDDHHHRRHHRDDHRVHRRRHLRAPREDELR